MLTSKMAGVIFLLIFSFPAHTQIITVKDKESGQPLEFVILGVPDQAGYIQTDARGKADISAFRNSLHVEIRMIGYKTEIYSFGELEHLEFLVKMKPSDISLDQVVISATRWNQPKREVPSKITAIPQRKIQFFNPQTAADMLELSGEVFIQKSQLGGGSPMIRGFSANRLLYAVDGIRMNTAIFRSGNLQNVISLDPFTMEQTEVFFGPGSVMYGSDAIGGVMGFQTLTPQFSVSGKFHTYGKAIVRHSTANKERTAHIDIRLAGKNWASVSSFSQFNFDDLRMGKHGPEEYLRAHFVSRIHGFDSMFVQSDPLVQKPSGYKQNNLMQKFRYKLGDALDVQYAFHYSVTSDYPRYDRLIQYRNDLLRYGEWYYGPQLWNMHQFTLSHQAESFLYDFLTLRLAQQRFEESRVERTFGKAIRMSRMEKVDASSLNVDFSKNILENQQFFYGFEGVLNKVKSSGKDKDITSGITVPGPSRYPQSDWSSVAFYLNYQLKPIEKFLVQAGIRYNLFRLDARFDTSFYPFPFTRSEILDRALTGSLGFVFNPSESWSMSASFASGFRSPNVDDVGKVFDSEPGSVVVPNPSLTAEYVYNAELAIAKIFGDYLKLDVSGYYTLLTNAMVRRNFTLHGADSILYHGEMSKVQALQNAAYAKVTGIQAGAEIKLPAGFAIRSRINYQKGWEELEDGSISPSRHAAPWFGSTHFIYTFHSFRLDFYSNYNGEKKFEDMPEEEIGKAYLYALDNNGNPYSPAWTTFTIKADFQITGRVSLQTGLENITDKRYRTYSSGISAPGRNWVLSMKVEF